MGKQPIKLSFDHHAPINKPEIFTTLSTSNTLQYDVDFCQLSPRLANLLPQYGWNAASTFANHNSANVASVTNDGSLIGSFNGNNQEIMRNEWPLDYGHHFEINDNPTIRLPDSQIFNSSLPDFEKQEDGKLDDSITNDGDRLNTMNYDWLAIEAAENTFRQLDAQLANSQLQ